jgi:hypothetical protein
MIAGSVVAAVIALVTLRSGREAENDSVSGAATPPNVRFVDVTRDAGIEFVHRNGAYGEKLLPETMGGGVAFFDFDEDGDPDLLFVGGCDWPWRENRDPRSSLALYRNDGGRFTDVTQGSGLEVQVYGMGAAAGDYDGDGRIDLFVSAVGGNRLFHNSGDGRFEDVTERSGVAGEPDGWSTSAAWIDVDRDGDLDLFVANYVRWNRAIDLAVDYRLTGIGRAYGPPLHFAGTFPYLYRNDGEGRFVEVAAESGLHVRNPATGAPLAKSLGVAPVDIDDDGWIDLVVANDTVQNFVFRNRGSGRFEEVGALAGVAFDSFGQTRGAMGIDVARFRNDDALGIAIGNFANEMNALYVSRRDELLFADHAIAEGLGQASQPLLKFGLFFFDYDLDGRLDLLSANGHIESEIEKSQPSQRYRQPAQLFWNSGRERTPAFVPVSESAAGADLFRPIAGRGSAFADMDRDGDLDVALSQIGGAPLLLRNDQALGHHWLRLRLVGSGANRQAIGAWVKARVAGAALARQVMPTRGYLSQSEPEITIGLGRASRVDRVEIEWPDGKTQMLAAPGVDQLVVVRKND